MNQYRKSSGVCQSAIDEEKERAICEAALDRALREGKLRGGPPFLPIRAAGELAKGALRGIPLTYTKTAAGRWAPFAELVDIIEITSVTGAPGNRCIKLKIRANEAGLAWAGIQ